MQIHDESFVIIRVPKTSNNIQEFVTQFNDAVTNQRFPALLGIRKNEIDSTYQVNIEN